MQKNRSVTLLVAAVVVILRLLAAPGPLFAASSERVLYSFCTLAGCPDGYNPVGAVIFDAAGNLYGETFAGGRYGDGTVFELMPNNGKWKEKVLHHFNRHGQDGAFPSGGLILDAAGNLYGTTSCYVYKCGTYGYGNVFELVRQNGKWQEKVLHSFNSGNDGANPSVGLILDATGNLYGTTGSGGTYGQGTVFELVSGNGKWTEKVLHSFNPNGGDGTEPQASLILDAAGNLYGTTIDGGSYSRGTAFELIPSNGTWTEKVLYSFGQNRNDAVSPDGMVLDRAGHVYGVSPGGGTYGYGTVFELLSNNGNWTSEVLHSFKGKDDAYPQGVILDEAGNLYVATHGGGILGGAVFKLTRSNGKWTRQVLHRFTPVKDGKSPSGPLVLDAAGNLYGLTFEGGAGGNGTVFMVRP